MISHHDWIEPDWPAPATVGARVTTRCGADSPYGGFNLALHVGDDSQRVQRNRAYLQRQLDVDGIQWLQQMHSTSVVSVSGPISPAPRADASYSRSRGIALAVLTADCLPILFCDSQGREVAVAHAGWRGLAGGIIGNTLQLFRQSPQGILAWLGPAICQCHYEVGEEVRAAFLHSRSFAHVPRVAEAFIAAGRAGHYQCDLTALARMSLIAAGVEQVYGGKHCSYGDQQRFYSYRRQPVCGRMATLIVLRER